MLIRLLALTLSVLSVTASLASEFAGSYRADQRLHGMNVVLRYDLILHSSGQAELRVTSDGGRISPREADVRNFGTVLEVLEMERRSVHSGSWSFAHGRVRVSLRSRNNRSLLTNLEFRPAPSGLEPTRWDARNYGMRSLAFSRVRGAAPAMGGWGWQDTGRWSEDAFRGTWEARTHLGHGRGDLIRRVVLERGNRARVEWNRTWGRDVRFDRHDLDRFGHLLLRLEREHSFEHVGRFELRGSNVILHLQRAGFDTVFSTLEFRIERDGLRLLSSDRRNYGNDRFFARER